MMNKRSLPDDDEEKERLLSSAAAAAMSMMKMCSGEKKTNSSNSSGHKTENLESTSVSLKHSQSNPGGKSKKSKKKKKESAANDDTEKTSPLTQEKLKQARINDEQEEEESHHMSHSWSNKKKKHPPASASNDEQNDHQDSKKQAEKKKSGSAGAGKKSEKALKVNKEADEEEDGILVPKENDILSGRGKFVNSHPGNVRFRTLVCKHKLAYVTCPKPQKTAYAELIVQELHKEGARFLKQAEPKKGKRQSRTGSEKNDSGSAGPSKASIDGISPHKPSPELRWYELDLKQALLKTRQALREGAPQISEQIQQQIHRKTNSDASDDDSGGSSSGDEVQEGNVEVVDKKGSHRQQRSRGSSDESDETNSNDEDNPKKLYDRVKDTKHKKWGKPVSPPAKSKQHGDMMNQGNSKKRAFVSTTEGGMDDSGGSRPKQQRRIDENKLRTSPSSTMLLSGDHRSAERKTETDQAQQRQLPPQLPLPQHSMAAAGGTSAHMAFLQEQGRNIPGSHIEAGKSSANVHAAPSSLPWSNLNDGALPSSSLALLAAKNDPALSSALRQNQNDSSSLMLPSSLGQNPSSSQIAAWLAARSGGTAPPPSSTSPRLYSLNQGNSGVGQLLHHHFLSTSSRGGGMGNVLLSHPQLSQRASNIGSEDIQLTNETNPVASSSLMMLLSQQQQQQQAYEQLLLAERSRLMAVSRQQQQSFSPAELSLLSDHSERQRQQALQRLLQGQSSTMTHSPFPATQHQHQQRQLLGNPSLLSSSVLRGGSSSTENAGPRPVGSRVAPGSLPVLSSVSNDGIAPPNEATLRQSRFYLQDDSSNQQRRFPSS